MMEDMDDDESEFEKVLRKAEREFALLSQGKFIPRVVVKDYGNGHISIKIVDDYSYDEDEYLALKETSGATECSPTKQWPTEMERICQGKHL